MVEERREFLTDMNAIDDLPYVQPSEFVSILDRREKRGSFTGYHYRIEFTKIGGISFISHLDLQKIIQRIFRRADIAVLQSEGHKLRPPISFGPALALGISSFQEFFDVRVEKPWVDLDEVLTKLQMYSERGIIFKSIQVIHAKDLSIQVAAKSFDYFLPFKYPIENDSDYEELQMKLQKILDLSEWKILSYSKKDDAMFLLS